MPPPKPKKGQIRKIRGLYVHITKRKHGFTVWIVNKKTGVNWAPVSLGLYPGPDGKHRKPTTYDVAFKRASASIKKIQDARGK